MRKIDSEAIGKWMHRNARALDLKIWECLFENGSNKEVADACMYYQNADGGFGHGIDPDNWNVNSLAYACTYVLETLKLVQFSDMEHPIFKGIKKYLNQTGIENWNFTVLTNSDYPHASFYNHSEAYNQTESTGIIIGLSAFVIEHMQGEAVYDQVMSKLPDFVQKIKSNDLGDMGPSAYIELVSAMKKAHIEGYDYEQLEQRLVELVNQNMQKDEKEWQNYGYRPSDFIKSKDSIFLKGNEEVVQKECDYLIRTLPKRDIWPVSWCWFDNAKLYPVEEKISLHIAKARKAIERMKFLREFGRA